jgi:plasmid stability protein
MATLQVKGINDRLYEALRARATMENRSISQEVVCLIRRHLARPPRDPREATHAMLELVGSWRDDRTARRIAAELRKSRRGGRRFAKDDDVFA